MKATTPAQTLADAVREHLTDSSGSVPSPLKSTALYAALAAYDAATEQGPEPADEDDAKVHEALNMVKESRSRMNSYTDAEREELERCARAMLAPQPPQPEANPGDWITQAKTPRELAEWAETIICNGQPLSHCSQEDWDKIVKAWRDERHRIYPDGPNAAVDARDSITDSERLTALIRMDKIELNYTDHADAIRLIDAEVEWLRGEDAERAKASQTPSDHEHK